MNHIADAFYYVLRLLAGSADAIPGLKRDPELGPSLDPEWFMPPIAEAVRSRPWAAALILMFIALIALWTFRTEE